MTAPHARLLPLSLLLVLAFGCRGQLLPAPGADGEIVVEGDEETHQGVYFIVPPGEEASDAEEEMLAMAAPGQRIIFLNRSGGTYTPGWNDSS